MADLTTGARFGDGLDAYSLTKGSPSRRGLSCGDPVKRVEFAPGFRTTELVAFVHTGVSPEYKGLVMPVHIRFDVMSETSLARPFPWALGAARNGTRR